jgi:hypothetical protein
MSRRPWRASAWALGLLLAHAREVKANPFELFGASARDAAMGGAMTAAVRGPGALHHNPAGLLTDRTHSLSGGLRLVWPRLGVERSPPDAEPEAALPESHAGLSLGWVKPLGGVLADRVAFGVSVAVPATRLLRIQGLDPAQPQFYLYQSLQEKLLIHLGAAGEPLPGLTIGAGVSILADLAGQARLGLDVPGDTFTRRELDVTLRPTASPVLGLRYAPPESSLAFGLCWRGESALKFVLPVMVSAGEALDLDIAVAQTVLWTPHQLAAGLTWTFGGRDPGGPGGTPGAERRPRTATEPGALTLALDLTWGLWSRAPDPSPRLSVDIGGRLVEAFGFGDALDLSTDAPPIALGFADTLTARAGLEWQTTSWLALRAGYGFRPTPAPVQTGATAYLDNDAHTLSAGAGLALMNPTQDAPEVLDLDVALQATVLPRQVVLRREGHPGGSLAHGGVVWHLATSAVHRF